MKKTIKSKYLASFDEEFAKTLREDHELRKIWEANAPKREITMAIMGERIKRKMTQAQLAKKAGLKQPNVARIERGQGISIDTLVKIANAFGKQLKVSFV